MGYRHWHWHWKPGFGVPSSFTTNSIYFYCAPNYSKVLIVLFAKQSGKFPITDKCPRESYQNRTTLLGSSMFRCVLVQFPVVC
jgi:hypothetical protein